MKRIEVGRYYANDRVDIDGKHEKNIIKVIPSKPHMPDSMVRTQTLWVKDSQPQNLFINDWVEDLIQREATEEEIKLFRKTRDQLNDLKSYGEIVSSE
ncbi:hypothetical protein FKN04_09520 [Bacillus glycinifermentans]|uniref:hypothetical protein n=1 Tax=Bacillus glycinifermentans TaxID=1664069 RepID=UPI001584346B|nr:hypothetical protein [Bacillus glycinifermentans]NUJ16831.1 hypothetical protein [Bacillus glycinifermentans]